ncbi:50S ribosomal protein L24 [Candidatus Margulisiibacteriota bacterium]
MNKLKKGDMIIVISGKDKGKKGKILKAFPQKQKVLVEKINISKKCKRADQNNKGGIVEKLIPINWSKVKLICPRSNNPTRVGFSIVDGQKKRKAMVSNEMFS